MSTAILVGDVRAVVKTLASESVHCIVTSPPYFGLRDYGCDGQIGLEPTPDDYVAEMVAVFRECRRVLCSDGTLWLNLGDSYNNARSDGHGATGGLDKSTLAAAAPMSATPTKKGTDAFLGVKQRLMIPARVALALQQDGWWLRDEIIWHKPNPMPVSVTDRTTPAHEMLYMFSKSARYHYDMEAVKEPAVSTDRKKWTDGGSDKQRGHGRQHAGFNGRYAERIMAEGAPTTRQPRSVWSIATRPFKGAHFATFPPDLVRPCIKAGCPAGGTVLDPFFGAGTTGLVAAELDRDCIGIELNPEYAAIASERLGLPFVASPSILPPLPY